MRFHAAALIAALSIAGWSAAGLAQQSTDANGQDQILATAPEWGGQGGVYTCEQWRAYVTRMYRLADVHHRGFIEAKDFEIIKKASPVFASASFDYFDEAGKGRVTQKQFIEFPNPFFARFDKKHNCHVTNEDIRQANAPAPTTPAQQKRRGGGRGGGMGGGRGM